MKASCPEPGPGQEPALSARPSGATPEPAPRPRHAPRPPIPAPRNPAALEAAPRLRPPGSHQRRGPGRRREGPSPPASALPGSLPRWPRGHSPGVHFVPRRRELPRTGVAPPCEYRTLRLTTLSPVGTARTQAAPAHGRLTSQPAGSPTGTPRPWGDRAA